MAVPEKLRVKINVVAFLILGLGLVYAMATQVLSVLGDRYSVFAIFPDAGGVFTNQEVTYRGTQVGQVGRLEVVPEGVRIELLIDDDFRIPARGVEARVMFKSAVGEQFVDLLPATSTAPFLDDGDTIPLSQTSIPVSTQELLATLEAVLRGVPPESLERTVDALGEGLTGLGDELGTIIESSADLATMFAERAPEVEGILESGTRVGDAFLDSRQDFAAAVDRLVVVSESLKTSRTDLERLLRGSIGASDEVVALLRQSRRELDDLIIELADINELQAEKKESVTRLLRRLPAALDRVVRAFEPTTGLVRFGLIQESGNPGCSYGTERRPPSDRDDRDVPKRGRCGTEAPGGTLRVAPDLQDPARGAALPARMADWSWSLFYFHGL